MGSTVDGLVSGLNTTELISQLMRVEAQGQTALKTKAVKAQSTISAYQSINAAFLGMSTAAGAFAAGSAWSAMKATSSNESALSATAGSGALAGTVTFDVTALASGASMVSSGSVTHAGATVASGGSITISKGGGTPVTITPIDGSLSAVVTAINNSPAGVRAAAVQTSPGSYKLQLSSSTTGAASAFTVSGIDGLGEFASVSAASDAVLTVGAGSPGQYTLASSTNTFSGALPGVTLTARTLATGVSVNAAPDVTGLGDKADAMVKAANAALDAIARQASYDPATKTGGPLLSDSTVRSLQQKVLSTINSLVVGQGTPSEAGIELTREGRLSFDRAAFEKLYAADPVRLQRIVGPSGAFAATATSPGVTGTVSFIAGTPKTREGSYDVVVTTAATRAAATLTAAPSYTAGQTVSLTTDGVTAVYTFDGTETTATLADRLNVLAGANNLSAAARLDANGDIRLEHINFGSSTRLALTVSGGLTASATTSGVDVAGTIGGKVATGSGQLLTAPANDPMLAGLTVRSTLTQADADILAGAAAGKLSYVAGVAQRLVGVAVGATDSIDGSLTQAISGRKSLVDDINKRVSSWDLRLALREKTLQRQFSGLEVALSKLRTQSQWLAGQLGASAQ